MNFKLSFSALVASLLLVGCVTDPDDLVPPQVPGSDGDIAINIDGDISQTYTTRVNDGGFCNDDQIGLFGVNYTADNSVAGTLLDEGNQVDNARYTYDEANNKWVATGHIYYKDAETNIDLYAYYPYGSVESVSEYPFEVANDQSGKTAVDGFAQSDFLWGKAENVTPSDAKVRIRFGHRMASANVVLVEGENFADGEWESLEKSVLVMNTTRTATINLATGVVTPTGDVSSEGIVMKENAEGFRAIVVPQSVEAQKALFAISIDGVPYRFKQDAVFTYEAGMQSNFTITVNKKGYSGDYEFVLTDTEIVDWVADLDTHDGEGRQYYVVHLDEAGTLEQKILADGKNPAKIKNLKVSGEICAGDIYFMRDKMDILKAINLKESEIVEGWSYYVDIANLGYHREYFGGKMPESENERRAAVRARYPDAGNINFIGTTSLAAHTIPSEAFANKTTLVNFVFPEKVTLIDYRAFSQTMLSGALIIPDDVEVIDVRAFDYTNITSLQLPHNLKVLGERAFDVCTGLAGSLQLPESLESIGSWCFAKCSMLSGSLVLPPKLTLIPDYCFYNCGFTGDLVISDNVESIEKGAFDGCNFNGRLTLSNSLKKIEVRSFAGTNFQGELFIPKSVISIEERAFDGNEFTNIVFEEGSELVKLGPFVFVNNWRLSEPLVLPAGLMTIGDSAFYDCRNLPAVIIPSTVNSIGEGAFKNCYYITSLRCEATMPPIVASGAFDGVPKDNFTLEVPEQSVSLYQTATGWSDFNRIGAHYDFSFERKHIRTLNAEYTETYLLRVPAGEEWSIESKPDWVTITPNSGEGRTEVTVTVGAMAAGDVGTFTREEMATNGNWNTETHAGRGGEVVFLLNDKEYRTRLTVEQYDAPDIYDGKVITNQTASEGEGVNIVFMGDCFDARDIATGKYLEGIDEAIGYYFAIEPYKHYKPYFNIYTVVGMSEDSGMGTVNTVKSAKFGSQYSLAGITPNTTTTYDYAMLTPTVDEANLNETLVVMVENTTDYGGICYMWADGSAIAICPMSRDAYPFDFRGIVQHEAGGHGFAKLADEYIYVNAFIESCECTNPHLDSFYAGKALGWYRNLSDNADYNTVEWAHLFDNPDYTNIVDMYEGGYFHTRGIYRSEANSCMNNNVPYYSAISRQEIVERIMRYAGKEFNINDFYANDVRDASNNDFETRAMMIDENSAAYKSAAGKQMPPKFMGDSPLLR